MPKMTKMIVAGALAALAATQPAAAAMLVNVQFTGPQQTVPAQTGAAVVGNVGDTWNQLFDNTGTASLQTADNVSSGYTISYAAQGVYASDPGYTQFTGTPVASLMQGYLYSSGAPITATVSGLRAGQAYKLYALTQGDDNTGGRQHVLSANGQTVTNTNTNTNTFVAGDNFALLEGRADRLGRIVLTNALGNGEANLNGFQLSAAVPEPATWAMMIGGIGTVGGTLRRRRARGVSRLAHA